MKVPGYKTEINGFDLENVLIIEPEPTPEPERTPEPEPTPEPESTPEPEVEIKEDSKATDKLPSTATNTYNFLLLGILLLGSGLLLFARRKKEVK